MQTLSQRIHESLRPFADVLAAELERLAESQKAAPVPRSNPLGINPEQLYTRQEAARLLSKHPETLHRAQRRRGPKQLTRRGSTSRPEYLGADLLKLANVESK